MFKKMDRSNNEPMPDDIAELWRRLRELRTPRSPEDQAKLDAGRFREAARRIATKAKRNGTIVRKPCEHCGSNENMNMHHEDYSRPLEVIWLCRKCHLKVHASARPNNKK